MTRFTHKSLSAALAMAAGIAFTSVPAATAEIGATLDEIIALAKKEGTVRIANSWRGPVLKALAKGAKAKYGIKFKQTRVSGISSRERILSEELAGLHQYDVVNVSGELRPQYIKANVIHKIPWNKLFPNIRGSLLDPDGWYLAAGFSRYGIIYNTKLVAAQDAPKSFEECLDPKWNGKMAVYTRPRTWTGMWPAWGREKSIDFHRKLKANGPIWTSNQTGTVAKIAAGEYPMGCGFPYHSYLNIERRDKTAAMAFVVPKEVPIQIGEAFAIMKGAKNPNAGILFAAYLASPDGQKNYKLYGRSTPFIDGTYADEHIKSFNAKVIFGGWDFAGDKERDAAKAIVEAWGFPERQVTGPVFPMRRRCLNTSAWVPFPRA